MDTNMQIGRQLERKIDDLLTIKMNIKRNQVKTDLFHIVATKRKRNTGNNLSNGVDTFTEEADPHMDTDPSSWEDQGAGPTCLRSS